MSPESHPREAPEPRDTEIEIEIDTEIETEIETLELGHPRGTLAVVGLYGALFVLGWILLYVFVFLPRGAPHP